MKLNKFYFLVLTTLISLQANSSKELYSDVCKKMDEIDYVMSINANFFCAHGTNRHKCHHTRTIKNKYCSVTDASDTNINILFNYKTEFLPLVDSAIKGSIRCLFSSHYEWVCLYNYNQSFMRSSTSTVRPFRPEAQQRYLDSMQKYLEDHY